MSDNTPTFTNFFHLFEHPIEFSIDRNLLDKRLRQLQKQYHPDNLNSNDLAKSQQNSAVINHAYDILINPDSRANYLLELSNQHLNANDSIADLDFLDDAMDLRVALDDAETNKNLASIKSIKSQVDNRINTYSNLFESAYSAKNWAKAMDATQKLKFLVKLNKDIETAIDNSQQQPENDDDLYL